MVCNDFMGLSLTNRGIGHITLFLMLIPMGNREIRLFEQSCEKWASLRISACRSVSSRFRPIEQQDWAFRVGLAHQSVESLEHNTFKAHKEYYRGQGLVVRRSK